MKSKNSLKNNNKLWEVAKKYIPGGNMFLSKRPERFLPGYWPTFYKKSKSINIYENHNSQMCLECHSRPESNPIYRI